jgi:hypothetical protein
MRSKIRAPSPRQFILKLSIPSRVSAKFPQQLISNRNPLAKNRSVLQGSHGRSQAAAKASVVADAAAVVAAAEVDVDASRP